MYGFTDRAESPVSLSIAQTGGIFSLLMLLLMLLVGWLVGWRVLVDSQNS